MYNRYIIKNKKWSKIPYPGEIESPSGIDYNTGYWVMNYFNYIGNGLFTNKKGKSIILDVKNPKDINFDDELKKVEEVLGQIEDRENDIINYWKEKSIVEIVMCIALKLLTDYEGSDGMKVRITSVLAKSINDAYIIATYFKYFLDIPRPIQLNEKLNISMETPKSPSYPSAYLTTIVTAIEILVHYFPKERDKLLIIQQQLGEARLYGGINFKKDLYEGVRLGKQIGSSIIMEISMERDIKGEVIDKFCSK